jgi:DNA-binding NtrC family response regulator
MAERPIANPTVLAVFPTREDRRALEQIFANTHWRLQFTSTLCETKTALERSAVGVVLSESRLPDGHGWTDVLHETQGSELLTPLVVVDRLADDRLWAEVLNMGGYDLLMKPFDEREVLHAVSMACRHCEDERRMNTSRKPPKSAVRSTALGAGGHAALAGR